MGNSLLPKVSCLVFASYLDLVQAGCQLSYRITDNYGTRESLGRGIIEAEVGTTLSYLLVNS